MAPIPGRVNPRGRGDLARRPPDGASGMLSAIRHMFSVQRCPVKPSEPRAVFLVKHHGQMFHVKHAERWARHPTEAECRATAARPETDGAPSAPAPAATPARLV